MSVHKAGSRLPRLGKGDFSTILLSHDFYKRIIKENPEFSHISWKEFQRIWVLIAEEIKIEAATNPLGVKLPLFLGELKNQYLPYKKEVQDHVLSQQEGDNIPLLNLHSKGKVGKLIWERKGARRFNKVLDLWAFEPSDLFRDLASEALRKTPDKFRIARTRVNNRTT